MSVFNWFRRSETIGDLIADSLENDRDEWTRQFQPMPSVWTFRNESRDWTVTITSPICFGVLGVSFNQCSLTNREKKRILGAVQKLAKDDTARARSDAYRKATFIRVVK